MTDRNNTDIEQLLNHPEVTNITDRINRELIERRAFTPYQCDVFSNPIVGLEIRPEFTFDIDLQAKKELPSIIHNQVQGLVAAIDADNDFISEYRRSRKIGIVFSGGPAPGGHNVIAGMYDAAKKACPQTKIFGFLLGPDGIIENETIELTDDIVDAHRNLGGFTMIKTGRTKIDTPQKMKLSRETCQNLGLDALVVVGGDDSNTNAAFLAEELQAVGVQVIGVPKTIDGDIQVRDAAGNVLCAMSFGFHTAARAFSAAIGNLCTDSSSDVKYWHICKVMGRVASHLALEVALQTHANLTLIGEDLADYIDHSRLEKSAEGGEIDYSAYGITLRHLSRVICNAIVKRAAVGKNYGVAVIPEGVLEFVNEIQMFIIKLNTIIAKYNNTHDTGFHTKYPALEDKLEYLRRLTRGIRKDSLSNVWNSRDDELFHDIPDFFQEGLLMERDSHGNFPFSQVKTEKVLMELVEDYLNILKEKGRYKIGIEKGYFQKALRKENLDPNTYGPLLFQNDKDDYLLMKDNIYSFKTLRQSLFKGGLLQTEEEALPKVVEKIYKMSVPSFKTQTHFYGYDGRGNNPTKFDCTYTYNLGLTVFGLIANGATGQMAAIRNLEDEFEKWEPIGIPIAPLMHLEERNGRLALVIEKSVVELNSPAFQIVEALRDKWLAGDPGKPDDYRHPGPIRFTGKSEEDRPITLVLNKLANGKTS